MKDTVLETLANYGRKDSWGFESFDQSGCRFDSRPGRYQVT